MGKLRAMLLIMALGTSTVSCSGTLNLGVTTPKPADPTADVYAPLHAAVAATLTASAVTSTPTADIDVEATVQAAVAATVAASGAAAVTEPTAVLLAPGGMSTLLYSTYLGGGDSEDVRGLAVDGEGNVYMVGTTSSPDLPTTPGAYDGSHNGNMDAFVAKLSPDGSTLLFSTYLGGSGEDQGNAIAVDDGGNVYVTGHTYSFDFPVTPGAIDLTLNGQRDGFVAKLSTAGDELIFSTYLGGDNWDYGHRIAVDDAGSAYVGGFTHGGFPVTPGAAQTTFGGSGDGFVVRLSPDAKSVIYSTYLGGWDYEGIDAIAIDLEGNAYLAGGTHSIDFPTTPGAYDTVCESCDSISGDSTVTKLSADGSEFIYSTLAGGADPGCGEGFHGVAVDPSGNAYVTGQSCSVDYPTTSGVLQPIFSGGQSDSVVTKLSADGSDLLYSTYLGGAGVDIACAIAVDATGSAYVAGFTDSADFPTAFPLQPASGGGRDAFVVKLDQGASTLLFGTYFGGSGDESGGSDIYMGFGLTSLGLYLGGTASSNDLATTAGAYDASFNGGTYDSFVAHLSPLASGTEDAGQVAPSPTPAAPTSAAPWEWVPATSHASTEITNPGSD